jgi:3-hydroxyisobutyrate dehydrogenase-like beta-hydroxyacid dehydrogenase
MRVLVVGFGRMGRAYAERLRAAGHDVEGRDRDDEAAGEPAPAELTLLALPRGGDVGDALARLDPERSGPVVDLTTQAPDEAVANSRAWSARGGRYAAGGCVGGATGVAEGRGYVVVAPPPADGVVAALRCFGDVGVLESLEDATLLKLLHNGYLVVANETARAVASVWLTHGLPLDVLVRTIERGSAGRPFGALTAVRQLGGGYESSYTGEYAAKDWAALLRTLSPKDRERLAFVDAGELHGRLASRGRGPYV